ncbi:MAG: FAD:protein FMN transferase [Planctomycetes bacterium]|nr:FAD:protein FMN transferase [Planctomycetota bacterium]
MIVRRALFAMGTRFEIALAGEGERALGDVAEAALAEIGEWDRRLSVFRQDSLLAHVNRTAGARPVRLDEDTFGLLRACLAVHRASGGAFDVTIGPAMRALGFHDAAAPACPGAAGAFFIGSDGLLRDEEEHSVRFARPGMALDLGAIGKGHALDLAERVVRQANGAVQAALLHGGTSTIKAIGRPPGKEGFDVAVRLPAPAGGAGPGRFARVTLADESLSVSGRFGRWLEQDGERLGHVIDPATARPITGGAALAAALSRSARESDAWSTALIALGRRPPALGPEVTSLIVPLDQAGAARAEESRAAGDRAAAFHCWESQ